MADFLILVNGLPGSGKTTLAARLAAALAVPLISKDAIKESTAGGDGRAASEAMWGLADAVPGTVVLESWWFAPRDREFVEAGRRRCGSPPTVEIWCQIAPERAKRRVEERIRHPMHRDREMLAERWATWAEQAEPLGTAYTIVVATDEPVDLAPVLAKVEKAGESLLPQSPTPGADQEEGV